MALSRRSASRLRSGLLLLLLVALIAPEPASGQTPTRDKPFPALPRARRWGPFLVDPRFAITNVGYDSNVFLRPTPLPGQPDIREGSFVVRAGPEVRAQMAIGRRMALTLHDRLAYEAFLSYPSLNHFDNDFDGQFDLQLGPLLLTTKGRLGSTLWRPYDEFVDRVRQRDDGLSQTLRFFSGPTTDVALMVARSRSRYSLPNSSYLIVLGNTGQSLRVPIDEALDRRVEDVSLEVGWRPRQRTRLFVRGLDRSYDFYSDRVGRDTSFRQFDVGVEFSPSSRISGAARVGRALLESERRELGYTDYDGLVGDARLYYRASGTLRFGAGFGRTAQFSTFENNLYYIETGRSLSVDAFLRGNWGVQGGYSVRDNDYPEVSRSTGRRRQDTVTDYYVGFLLRMRGGLETGLRVGRRQRESTIRTIDDEQTYVTTSVSYVF